MMVSRYIAMDSHMTEDRRLPQQLHCISVYDFFASHNSVLLFLV